MRIYAFGDSITEGASDTSGGWAVRLHQALYAASIDQPDETHVINLGISGNTAVDIMHRIAPEIRARKSELFPERTLTLIAVGVNDSMLTIETGVSRVPPQEFVAALTSSVQSAQEFTDEVWLLTITTIDQSQLDPISWLPECAIHTATVTDYNELIAEVAESTGARLIDRSDWIRSEHLYDGLHPNSQGHEVLAERMLPLIQSYLGK